MRLLIALVTGLAVLALAACSEPNADGPHRSQSGPYIGGSGGGGF
jgi:hypothetical protein